MTRVLLTVLLFILLLSTHPNPSGSTDPALRLLASVKPIQGMINRGDFDATGSPILELTNICTCFSVNQDERLFATKEHCTESDGVEITFQNAPLDVVMREKDADLAIIRGRVGAPPLKLERGAPTFLQHVIIAGYPLGNDEPYVMGGAIANPSVKVWGWPGNWTAYAIPDAAGMSGAPIVNDDLEVVSIHTMGFSRTSFNSVGYGSRWEELKLKIGVYFKN